MIRLDKFITNNTLHSRSTAVNLIRGGRVLVNGKKLKPDQKIDENIDMVTLDGVSISYKKFIYLMLNKPQGVVSATNDKQHKTVLDLVGDYKNYNLFPCGRLDKDTLGLVILTNDGQSAHNNLSPKHHVKKKYAFECAEPLLQQDIEHIEQGVLLKDGYTTKPCEIILNSSVSGEIVLTEGKYHEIKRIFGALGNKIIYLERISFGDIVLDKNLARGEFRELTTKEINYFTNNK